jgi:hypothetical protein
MAMGQSGARKALACGSPVLPPAKSTVPAGQISRAHRVLQSKRAMRSFKSSAVHAE